MKTVPGPDGKPYNFPDDASHAEIADFFKLGPAASRSPRLAAHLAAPAPGTSMQTAPGPGQRMTMAGLNLAPSALGIMGDLAGNLAGPAREFVSPPLSALGGAIGEAGRQLGYHAMGYETPDAMAHIGESAALQGASSVVGGVVAKGAAKIGGGLVERALGPALTSIKRRFPMVDVVDEMVKRRMGLSSDAASQAAAASGATASGMVGGSDIGAHEIAQPAIDQFIREEGRQPTIAERSRLMQQSYDLMRSALGKRSFGVVRQPGAMPVFQPGQVQDIKQVLQRWARGAFNEDEKSLAVSANPDLTKKLAIGAQAALERRSPGLAEQNANTRTLMAITQAARGAEAAAAGGRRVPVINAPLLPSLMRSTLIPRVTPRTAMNAGRFATDPRLLALLRTLPFGANLPYSIGMGPALPDSTQGGN